MSSGPTKAMLEAQLNKALGMIQEGIIEISLLRAEADWLAKELFHARNYGCPTNMRCTMEEHENRTPAGCIKCWREAARKALKEKK